MSRFIKIKDHARLSNPGRSVDNASPRCDENILRVDGRFSPPSELYLHAAHATLWDADTLPRTMARACERQGPPQLCGYRPSPVISCQQTLAFLRVSRAVSFLSQQNPTRNHTFLPEMRFALVLIWAAVVAARIVITSPSAGTRIVQGDFFDITWYMAPSVRHAKSCLLTMGLQDCWDVGCRIRHRPLVRISSLGFYRRLTQLRAIQARSRDEWHSTQKRATRC